MKKQILILVLALVTLLAVPSVALAQEGEGRFVFGGNYVLESGDVLRGDLVVMGGTARTERDSLIDGSIVIMGGSVSIAGGVAQDITVMGGSVELESTAIVNGQVISIGGAVDPAPGADVRGDIVESFEAMPFDWMPRMGMPYGVNVLGEVFGAILSILAIMALAVLVILLLPEQTDQVIDVLIAEPWLSAGTGFLTMIVSPLLMLILLLTCIGPLLWGIALGIAALFGWIAIGLFIGRKALEAINAADATTLVQVLVGVGIITLLSRVPCIGWLISLVGASFGLGAVILSRFGTSDYPWEPRPTEPIDYDSLPETLNAEARTQGEISIPRDEPMSLESDLDLEIDMDTESNEQDEA